MAVLTLLSLIILVLALEGTTPISLKQGKLKPGCVPSNPNIRCVWFNDECKSNDANCPKGQICCGHTCGTTCSIPVCDQPKSVISCKIGPPRTKSLWYYDKNMMRCRKFKADECSGNNNNFSSRKSCNKVKATCVCLLPKVPGPCRGSFQRFFYNSLTDKCEQFIYGGCKGNKNNFKTLRKCKRRCGEHPPQPPTPPPPPPPLKCQKGIPLEITCGLGPGSKSCPTGYYCVFHRRSSAGFCCQVPCKYGSPHKTLSCGMVVGSNKCPKGYYCEAHPADQYFACCPNGPGNKPGICPVPTGAGACVEQCSKDGDCVGTQKCCSNGCGHTCTNAVPETKLGFCPILPPGTVGHCAELCSGDSSCPGIQKCCSNGCGHVCSQPTGGVTPQPCDVGFPLQKNGDLVFCGKRPNIQVCPKGYLCNGVTCCQQVCKFGQALKGVVCGRGPGRKDCPKGYTCNISPTDEYAVCCPTTYLR